MGRLCDETVTRALAEGLVSRHVSAEGTLVRADAGVKSFVPIEVAVDPAGSTRRLRAQDREASEMLTVAGLPNTAVRVG